MAFQQASTITQHHAYEDVWCAQDTSWLDTYLSHIPHVVYQVDDPEKTVGAQHATLKNKGNEAMGYLQFIVDYYDRLPSSIVFLHGHRLRPADGTGLPSSFFLVYFGVEMSDA